VSAHVLFLALLSGLRPATAQAAVLVLLRGPSPRGMLLAYCAVGLIWTLTVGALVITVFDGLGSQLGRRRSDFTAIFELMAGVAALGFAAGVERGRLLERIHDRHPVGNGDSRLIRRLRSPSAIDSAVAGVVTHVPGLIYLVALNAIAAADIGTGRALFQLGAYNLLWFLFPITALGLALTNPALIVDTLDRAGAWASRNRERLVVMLFGVLGLYLVVKSLVELLR
jgi:hypothetical protein